MEIVWQDPPSSIHDGGGRTKSFVAALKERPGIWALYPTPLKGAASTYRKNYPGVEWVTRTRGDGMQDLYGRWVGES